MCVGKRIKTVIPWVFALGILWWLLEKYDPALVWKTLSEVNLGYLLVLWTATVLIVFVADTLCLALLFRMCRQTLPMPELFTVKAASYLLNVVNYNAAAGGIGFAVSRRNRTPLMEALSSMLMLSGLDVLALVAFVVSAFAANPEFLPAEHRNTIGMICAVILLGYAGVMILWNLRKWLPASRKWEKWGIFYCLRVTGIGQHGTLVALRMAFLSLYFVTQYFSLLEFGISIPLVELFGLNAILTLVGIVPISVAGLGTTQWVMVALYAVYDDGSVPNFEATVLAYSTAIIAYFVLVRVVLGYLGLARMKGIQPD